MRINTSVFYWLAIIVMCLLIVVVIAALINTASGYGDYKYTAIDGTVGESDWCVANEGYMSCETPDGGRIVVNEYHKRGS